MAPQEATSAALAVRPPPPTDGRAEESGGGAPAPTEQAIVEAATRCVRRYGIRRTTLEEVARAAGFSRGTVYRYFRSKDDLITAVFAGAYSAFLAEARSVLDGCATLAERVAANAVLIRDSGRGGALLDLDETEPETVALLLTRDAGPMLARWIDFWTPYFVAARQAGEVRADLDIPQAVEWTLRMLLSLATTPPVTFDLDDDEALRAFVTHHLVGGFR